MLNLPRNLYHYNYRSDSVSRSFNGEDVKKEGDIVRVESYELSEKLKFRKQREDNRDKKAETAKEKAKEKKGAVEEKKEEKTKKEEVVVAVAEVEEVEVLPGFSSKSVLK